MKKINIDGSAKRTASLEALFRSRAVWRKFCESIINERRVCEICFKDLTKKHVRGKKKGRYCVTPNVHHMHKNPTMADYMNLDPRRFMLLCPNCHDWVHKVFNSPRFKEYQWVNKEG